MAEMRQFLRYVTPGWVFLIELISVLVLGGKGRDLLSLTEAYPQLFNIGSVLAAIFASGAAGYLFSIVYHNFLGGPFYGWRFRKIRRRIINTGDLENHILVPSWFMFFVPRNWLVVSTFWFSRLCGSSVLTEKATDRSANLADLAHGSGTTFVAAVFVGLLSYFVLDESYQPDNRGMLLALGFVILHGISFLVTARNNVRFVEAQLDRELKTRPHW